VRAGIFGTDDDPQCAAVMRELRGLGADPVLLRADALDEGLPLSFADGRVLYGGQPMDDLRGCYVRSVPLPSAPAFSRDGGLRLYRDWHVQYMHSVERASVYVSWLLSLGDRGCRLINPPHAASVLQYKPYQLDVLRELGAPVPRTLISNDPKAVRAFAREVKRVVFKPVMGGALTRALDRAALSELDAIRSSPVTFQERIDGDDVRVMLAGGRIISAVAIRTPAQHLDFRADPVYASGEARYEPVKLPRRVAGQCRAAARRCGLLFAGVDLKRTAAGDFVFLELNSSPIYLDVELKLGHPISEEVAKLVVGW
jgi:glutathione synthase/RimK-type ligase-like ATP-grasp enzyme